MAKKAPATPSDPGPRKLRDPALGALLLAVALIAYWPALQGGLIWDDAAHVTRPALRSLHGLWRIWFDLGSTQQYYPLLHSAFWLEHRLWGTPWPAIIWPISGCMASAFLVVAIMRRLALPGAWLAAFIFALHPLCVESVAWMSEQKTRSRPCSTSARPWPICISTGNGAGRGILPRWDCLPWRY